MAISEEADLISHALWPQGDQRDPLGVWGFRHGVTGDASGGSIKVGCQVPAAQRDAHVYTLYAANFSQLTGTDNLSAVKIRLLTNWPNVDPAAGIQGFATHRVLTIADDAAFTSPQSGFSQNQPVLPNERFLLLFTRIGTPLTIVEFEHGSNVNLATYSFELYGYYWDARVLNAPGGPRHPGSS